jgi:hypothetical protein
MESLHTLATRLLNQAGNDAYKALPGFLRVLQKRPELLNTVAYAYLDQVAATVIAPTSTADTSGQLIAEAHVQRSAPSAVPLNNQLQQTMDPLRRVEPKSAQSIPVNLGQPEPVVDPESDPEPAIDRPHAKVFPDVPVDVCAHTRGKPQRRRTQEEKENAIAAKMQLANAIFTRRLIAGRPIGKIRYCEAQAMLDTHLAEATAALNTSTNKVHDWLLLRRITDHVTPSDPNVEIAELISAEKLIEFDREAMLAVSKIVDKGKEVYAAVIQETQNARSLPHAQ